MFEQGWNDEAAVADRCLQEDLRATTPPRTVRPWPLPVVASPRIERLRAAVRATGGRHEREAVVDEFLAELQDAGSPLVEPGEEGWELFTFIWRGAAPHGVVLHLNGLTDRIDLADTLLDPVEGTSLHTLTVRMPEGWLASYFLARLPRAPKVTLHAGVDRHELARLLTRAVEDPFARELIPSPIRGGGTSPPLAVARGTRSPWVSLWRDSAVPVCPLGTIQGPMSGVRLPVSLWSHPCAGRSHPVLLFADGEVWREAYPIIPELKRRISAGACPPVHVMFLESVGAHQRQWDLPASAGRTRRVLFRLRALVPNLLGPWIIVGQSLGGLFAAQCATRHPELITAAVAQSPSLWWPATAPGENRGPGWFEERATSRPGAPVLLQGGIYEWNLIDRIRDAAAMLRSQDALLGFTEYPGGHDVLAWQALLPDAVQTVLTAPACARLLARNGVSR